MPVPPSSLLIISSTHRKIPLGLSRTCKQASQGNVSKFSASNYSYCSLRCAVLAAVVLESETLRAIEQWGLTLQHSRRPGQACTQGAS
jgi:hypothetical protein